MSSTHFRGRLRKRSAVQHMARQLCTMGVGPLVLPESFFMKSMKKEGPLVAGKWKEQPVGPGHSPTV